MHFQGKHLITWVNQGSVPCKWQLVSGLKCLSITFTSDEIEAKWNAQGHSHCGKQKWGSNPSQDIPYQGVFPQCRENRWGCAPWPIFMGIPEFSIGQLHTFCSAWAHLATPSVDETPCSVTRGLDHSGSQWDQGFQIAVGVCSDTALGLQCVAINRQVSVKGNGS
jgi:hypothetical protein